MMRGFELFDERVVSHRESKKTDDSKGSRWVMYRIFSNTTYDYRTTHFASERRMDIDKLYR